jgi:hypothetical protein
MAYIGVYSGEAGAATVATAVALGWQSVAPCHVKIHKTTKLIDKIPGVSNCYFRKFVYPKLAICNFKNVPGLHPRTPLAGGGDPLPHPAPARPAASHGDALRPRLRSPRCQHFPGPPCFLTDRRAW